MDPFDLITNARREMAGAPGEVAQEVRELAARLLAEGLERGEDRRRFIVDVRDQAGNVVLELTLAEAADGNGLVNLH